MSCHHYYCLTAVAQNSSPVTMVMCRCNYVMIPTTPEGKKCAIPRTLLPPPPDYQASRSSSSVMLRFLIALGQPRDRCTTTWMTCFTYDLGGHMFCKAFVIIGRQQNATYQHWLPSNGLLCKGRGAEPSPVNCPETLIIVGAAPDADGFLRRDPGPSPTSPHRGERPGRRPLLPQPARRRGAVPQVLRRGAACRIR